MVLDVRAQVVCNLGPIIAGSVKDDHVQGQGLVFTTGELTLAGLHTPAHGTVVSLGYVTPAGTQLARFPRGPFRVVRAFANPLSNQTEVQLANELAFQRGKGGGTVRSALVDAFNGRVPRVASAIDLREAFVVMAQRLGITVGELGSWTLPKQQAALDSPDYIETMGEILASVGRFGYLDAANVLQTVAYRELGEQGPLLGFDQVIDLSPNAGGLDFTDNPTGSGEAQQITEYKPVTTASAQPTVSPLGAVVEPGEAIEDSTTPVVLSPAVKVQQDTYGSFSAAWDNSGLSTATQIKVSFFDQTKQTFAVSEEVITSELKAEPDNRVVQRNTETRTSLVKLNSQVVQDYINRTKKGGSSSFAATGVRLAGRLISTSKTDNYVYEEIPPPPLSEQEQAQLDQEINSIKQQQSAAGAYFSNPATGGAQIGTLLPKQPTYRKVFEQTLEEMSFVEALGRLGVPDYTKFGAIPSGKGIKEIVETSYLYGEGVVKEFKRVYVAYGLTQMGQQAMAAAALRYRSSTALDFLPLLDSFFDLVLEDYVITTRDVDQQTQQQPVPQYLAPFAVSTKDIQGGSSIAVNAEPPSQPNKALSFAVPFLPDDVVNDNGSVTPGNAEALAADYAEQQNRLLLAHRLGLQVTTALGVLPTVPLGAFHLSNGNLAATYRSNGLAIAFDASSCLVSTDALYWGLAGGDINGGRWTPVAPGTGALPPLPPVVDNGPQAPVNSIAFSSAASDHGSIAAVVSASLDYGTITQAVTANSDQGLITTLVVPSLADSAAVAEALAALPVAQVETFAEELAPTALTLPYKPITTSSFAIQLQVEAQLVPLGIERDLGNATGELRLQCNAVQQLSSTVWLQLQSSERQLLAETFAIVLNLQATLS